MTAPVRQTTLGKSAPRDIRAPRLRFTYRCVECGAVFSAPANGGYCCGQYADEYDACECCRRKFEVGTLQTVRDFMVCDSCAGEM